MPAKSGDFPAKRKGSYLKDSTFVTFSSTVNQLDKDSGRGDSDHEAASFDGKGEK